MLQTLNEGGYRLCMAKACGEEGGQPVYNVVAVVAGNKLCFILS
jgi:hypothetical protein